MTEQEEILMALEEERQLNNRPLCFRVEQTLQHGGVFKVIVNPEDDRSSLDESLEGLTAKWTTPNRGHANILSVVPEDNLLNLRFATGTPPPTGELIWVQVPDFLVELLRLWQDTEMAKGCLKWLHDVRLKGAPDQNKFLQHDRFALLRPRQREAFRLCGCRKGFLWGPPGTGKTTTLGSMLAQYLVQFPYNHVLLLSTTNTAVDQVLIAVDKALDYLGDSGAEVKNECKRIGLHFVASHYDGREHLLPNIDVDLIRRLSQLEAEHPDPRDDHAFALWRDAIDSVREEIREFARQDLIKARLAAMTTTRATFDFEVLQTLGYDLVAFDEASQVGLSHALMLRGSDRRFYLAETPTNLARLYSQNWT